MAKAKLSTVIGVHKKLFGSVCPTPSTMKGARVVADMLTEVYIIAQKDARECAWTLPKIESVIKDNKDVPTSLTNWLIDAARKTYNQSYQERRQRQW